LLFSLPTICDPIPLTQPGSPNVVHKSLEEDDWRQIEFVPVANRGYLESKLKELSIFREQHRRGPAFTKIFIRPEHPATFEGVGFARTQLPHLTELALTLGRGTVPGGFALSDGGTWFIYGQRSPEGRVHHLAVSPGRGDVPSEQFIHALGDIAANGFLLVDWYVGVVVDTSSSESILSWTRRFQ